MAKLLIKETTKTELPDNGFVKPQKIRYNLLDSIRGFALLNMILYHALYDLVYMFGYDFGWFISPAVYVWQQCICWTFILISGASANLGKRPVKKAILLLLSDIAISIVTYIAEPSQAVRYGVLFLLGVSSLLIIPIKKLSAKIESQKFLLLLAFVCFCLFFVTRNVPKGSLGFEGFIICSIPQSFYSFEFLTPIGFAHSGFSSGDFFPIIPWFFLYTAGFFLFAAILRSDKAAEKFVKSEPILSAIGRKSLIIYLAHQPVIYLALTAVEYLGSL